MLRLKIKNYRCFGDQKPVAIDYARGFTALVGPNNSGKSALLRLIYEHRDLWNRLSDASWVAERVNDKKEQDIPLRGISDAEEVICDYTKRPLAFSTEWLNPPAMPHLKAVTLSSRPKAPTYWAVRAETSSGSPLLGSKDRKTLTNDRGEVLDWTAFSSAFEDFTNSLFAPAFRNAINEGTGSFFDLAVGTAVVSQWNSWKAGTNRASKIAIQDIQRDIAHIFGFGTLDINSSADGKTLEVIVDRRPFRLNDLGAGLTQFIILFINLAIRKPALLLIDEPELNLHPRLQTDFLTAAAAYTASSSVIFATHSIGLARAIADRIYTFSSTPDGAVVTPLEATPSFAQFAGEMNYGSYEALGFRTILMVEGPSEIKAVQQFLRLLGHDHDIVILHLGGSSLIGPGRIAELAELKRITEKVAVLIDSEKTDEHAPIGADRRAFLDDCNTLGYVTHATARRAFENYLTDAAIQTVKGPKYRALTPYEALRSTPLGWDKNENWRMARAMSKEDLMATDIGQFLDKVCSTL